MNRGAQVVRDEGLREFGEALVRLLDVRGMSRVELADAINVAPSTISNWTLGRARPSAFNVEATEDALDVPRGHLTRYLGYTPVSEGPRAETLEEFLRREGLLAPDQQQILVLIHASYLKKGRRQRGRQSRRAEP